MHRLKNFFGREDRADHFDTEDSFLDSTSARHKKDAYPGPDTTGYGRSFPDMAAKSKTSSASLPPPLPVQKQQAPPMSKSAGKRAAVDEAPANAAAASVPVMKGRPQAQSARIEPQQRKDAPMKGYDWYYEGAAKAASTGSVPASTASTRPAMGSKAKGKGSGFPDAGADVAEGKVQKLSPFHFYFSRSEEPRQW